MKITWLKLLNYFHLGRQTLGSMALDLLDFFCVRLYLIILLGLNLLNWLAAVTISSNVSQNLVVLHYNVNFGVDLIGSVRRIYTIPLLGLIIILINFILLVLVYRQSKFIIHLLLAPAILANLFLLIAIASVYLINFR